MGTQCQGLPTHEPLVKHLLMRLKRPRVQSESNQKVPEVETTANDLAFVSDGLYKTLVCHKKYFTPRSTTIQKHLL